MALRNGWETPRPYDQRWTPVWTPIWEVLSDYRDDSRCVLGRDASLSRYLSLTRSTNGYRGTVGKAWRDAGRRGGGGLWYNLQWLPSHQEVAVLLVTTSEEICCVNLPVCHLMSLIEKSVQLKWNFKIIDYRWIKTKEVPINLERTRMVANGVKTNGPTPLQRPLFKTLCCSSLHFVIYSFLKHIMQQITNRCLHVKQSLPIILNESPGQVFSNRIGGNVTDNTDSVLGTNLGRIQRVS